MQEDKPGNRAKAITITVLLHVLLGAALILGIEFSDYRPLSGPKVDIVEAELVTTPPVPRVDPEIERRRREQEAEAERRQQEEAQEQERLQQQQAEAQRKQVAALARQKSEIEAKRKAELDAKKKAESAARKKAQEEARRKKVEEEARLKAQAEQQAREEALREALAQEQRERELNPLRAAYSAAISQKIAQNWLRPPSITDDLKCEVLVTQLPDGSVTGARITRSSGNAVFDESVIKAIYKAAPLPPPPSPEVFDRELDIGFCSTGELC